MNKRQFLKTLGLSAVSAPVFGKNWDKYIEKHQNDKPVILAQNEDFWAQVRSHYTLNTDFINLENGYYCITPDPIRQAFIKNIEECNRLGSYYMRTKRFSDNELVRKHLAPLLGCGHEEVIITRNTTESLDTVISGYDWKPGDEAVMAIQDYPSMVQHFELMARRYGMVNKVLSVPNHPQSDEEIVNLYEKAITPRTRLLMVCHIINITGQILPIRKITDMAHKHGVDVLVDGAHAVGHFQFNISDLGCDYYGASLHKWLSAPLGVGMLYVKKNKIKDLWQLYGDTGYTDQDIRKLNHTGTPAVHTDISIINAIDYLNKIGLDKKEARLRYIQTYWSDALKNVPNVVINTPTEAHRKCGIGNVGLKNMKPTVMAERLLKEYKIWTVGIEGQNVFGCRITPNIYTSINELDTFVFAVKELVRR